MGEPARCEERNWTGRRCTRYAVKTLGDGTRTCGLSHERPARSEKIDRNATCPCGSGRKWKRCCWLTTEAAHG